MDFDEFKSSFAAALTAAEHYSGEAEFDPIEDFLAVVRTAMENRTTRRMDSDYPAGAERAKLPDVVIPPKWHRLVNDLL